MSQFIQLTQQDPQLVREELLAGLLAASAQTSPKYLYDALGSKLFEAICELPEYYPTRTEAQIFASYADEIAAVAGTGATLIDLGAGNCAKAASLFPALQPSHYVPIDISVQFLRDAVSRLQSQFPRIAMTGIGMDFSSRLDLPTAVPRHNRLFFYPGSSIGNFTPQEALAFLARVHAACLHEGNADGGILISIDLVKDAVILDAAYDDALGVTASFNLNLLQHLNHLLQADFDLRAWRHRGFFNAKQSRIEMHLEALSPQTVRWPGGVRRFEEGERIHTENSYKYTQQDFIDLLTQAGFVDVTVWSDPQQWFMVCHARAVQPN
ncbi:L-histidine N(alpha)-methyltransferase [Oxalicibacterium faecigallinarum]|uniref:Dimethylhistidine N-methyltransferase n=1 Tax=Oxalicibacterium faecigallinarum TaxID=573741 RepID=A0A8J3F0H2_9BURK|nr:L-histidine N(alpha)-methyltransferase [Oxalicibacterium faecigallinarum]GGI15994.1 dimethylhistidine N-methyltransferase [Oxalicibacterium faecigallinarum]